MNAKAIGILTSIFGAVVSAAGADPNVAVITRDNAPRIEKALIEKAAENPVVINAVNAERPLQSGVAWGGAGGVLASAAIIIAQLSTREFPNYDWGVLGPAIAGVWAGAYVLYRRFWTGLKPLFSGDAAA